jgi:glycosyltransferase involved in cell wall biosynthesis
MNPSLSFILPCYNVQGTVSRAVASILEQTTSENFEIILVNNNSTDHFSEGLPQDHRIKIIPELQQGPGNARNAGARAARGKYLVFMDADVFLPSDWTMHLLSTFTQHSWIDVVVGTLLPDKKQSHLLYLLRLYLLDIRTKNTRNHLHANSPLINSALFAIRASSFNYLGGFEVKLLRMEDWHFTQKFFHHSLNACPHYVPAGVIFEADSLWKYFVRSFKNGWYSRLLIKEYQWIRPNFPELFKAQDPCSNPMLDFLRITNNVFYIMGYLANFFPSPEESIVAAHYRPSKNHFHFQMAWQGVAYGLNPSLGIILLKDQIVLMADHWPLVKLEGYAKDLLLKLNQRGVDFSLENEVIIKEWIQNKVLVRL